MFITFSTYLVNTEDISVIQFKNIKNSCNEISIKFTSHPDRILYEIYKQPVEVNERFAELCHLLQADKLRVLH